MSASADIVVMSDKRNLSSERNSMCDLWRHLSSCVLLCGAIDGVRGALMGPLAPSGANWSKEPDGKKIGVSITGGR